MANNLIENELQNVANPQKAVVLSRFFKTNKGEYGENDQFIGVTVPQQRAIAKKYKTLEISEIEQLLHSKIHEYRMTALLFLVEMFKHEKSAEGQEKIYKFYLKNAQFINNWDLVDLTAPTIVGQYLLTRDKSELYKLAESQNIWEQRIAIVCTWTFIRKGFFEDTLALAKILLHHPHDLLQKAVGWMLREVGKRNFDAEFAFLTEEKRYQTMPRTMLRYAIEKFPEELRQQFLHSEI